MRLRQCTDVETNVLVSVLGGKVQGGFPNPTADYYEPPISLDELLNLRAPHIWLAETEGDSMSGIGIYHGTLLVIDRSVDAEVGDIVVVYVNNQPIVSNRPAKPSTQPRKTRTWCALKLSGHQF